MSYIEYKNVSVILRIIYLVDINVFHTLPLFKYKMWSTKAHSCAQIAQKAKWLQKGEIHAKPTEINSEKQHTFTQLFFL